MEILIVVSENKRKKQFRESTFLRVVVPFGIQQAFGNHP